MTQASSTLWDSSKLSRQAFDDPIGFIRREHDRQCEICYQLEDMVNALDQPPDLGQVELIRGFLAEDLNLHVQDEETDLFPALARRCKSHELVDEILYQLTSEHELDRGLIDPILDALREIAEGRAAQNTARLARSVRAFVETQHRHLNWENRVILPMAETHLTAADKQAIGRSMAVRRGLTNPA